MTKFRRGVEGALARRCRRRHRSAACSGTSSTRLSPRQTFSVADRLALLDRRPHRAGIDDAAPMIFSLDAARHHAA